MMTMTTRKRRRTALGVAAALAVATTALAASQPASAADVTGGTIDWGVRGSFRSYVLGFAAGSITTGGGATQNAGNGTFVFPVGGGTHEGAATSASSSGSVHFEGHDGFLDISVSDVRVSINGNSGSIIADVVSREFISFDEAGELITYDDVELVSLDLTGVTPVVTANSVTYTAVPTTLTASGAPAFGSFYPAGDAFDPVTVTLAIDDDGGPGPVEPGDPRAITGGGLRWILSRQAWTSSSLNPCHTAFEPATYANNGVDDPTSGVTFPVSQGSYDATTGATTIELGGGFFVGNQVQGGYGVLISDPTIVIDADGNGELSVDLGYRAGGGGSPGNPVACGVVGELGGSPWVEIDDVLIVTFDADALTVGEDGTATWTLVPIIPPAPDPVAFPYLAGFDDEFINALAESLRGHFRHTSGTAGPNKPPAPAYLTFSVAPPPPSDSVELVVVVSEEGTLAISVAEDQIVFDDLELSPDAQSLTADGELGGVTVTDTRTANPGWNVNAQITDFSGDAGTFSGDALGWAPGVVSTGAGQTVTPGAPVAAGVGISGAPLASAISGQGRGTAELDAGLELEVPTDVPPGEYSAVLTLTAI